MSPYTCTSWPSAQAPATTGEVATWNTWRSTFSSHSLHQQTQQHNNRFAEQCHTLLLSRTADAYTKCLQHSTAWYSNQSLHRTIRTRQGERVLQAPWQQSRSSASLH
jgi:hypothetical protein